LRAYALILGLESKPVFVLLIGFVAREEGSSLIPCQMIINQFLFRSLIVGLFVLVLFVMSCGSNNNLNYIDNKNDYVHAAECLLSYKYGNILSPDSLLYAISVIHKEDLDKFNGCSSLRLLFNQEPLDYVSIKEDSSMYFYSKPSGWALRSKQYILLHYSKGALQNLHLTRDLRLIKEIDTSWYQLERITSLAD
jgi:hypothetical protein